jgi:hypothetical protein
MIYNLFNVKCCLENHLLSDVITLIQYNFYLLNIKNDVMSILDDYFKYYQENDKLYIAKYKKSTYTYDRIYVNKQLKWYNADNYDQYITLTYKKIKIKNEYRDGLMIRMSRPTSHEDLPSFKRIESRIMENTIYTKVKSRYNRIYLV